MQLKLNGKPSRQGRVSAMHFGPQLTSARLMESSASTLTEVARITCGRDTTNVGRYGNLPSSHLTETFLHHLTRFVVDAHRLADHAS